MCLINFQFTLLQEVMNILLQDKTTGKNIIWATDDYIKYGEDYSATSELTFDTVYGLDDGVLQPRVSKSKEVQKDRTKAKAEVFTPSWVCDNMNTFCDSDWFSNKKSVKGKVYFTFEDEKSVKKYIDTKKLEITCGEAPFIVSRYDTTTGNIIPIIKRIGFLDRKLLAINQYIKEKEDWVKMVYRAYENTYGYEFQGDNLLKARINLFMTFIDNYYGRFRELPTDKEIRRIANTISRNLWQMDGLRYTVPLSDIKCVIHNWRSKKSYYFEELKGEDSMKFDYIVGNPPYQLNDGGGTGSSAKPIYKDFIEESKKIGKDINLIVPARWMTGGKGLDEFRDEMIHDHRMKNLVDFANSKDVFQGVDIKGGVCYFEWNAKYSGKCKCIRVSIDGEEENLRYLCEDGDDVFIRELKLVKIKEKVVKKMDKNIINLVSMRNPYGFFSDSIRKPEKYNLPLLSSEKIEKGYSIYGLVDGKNRGFKYMSKDYPIVKENRNLKKFKIFIPKAYGCGNIGEVPSTPVLGTPVLGTPDMLCTETFLEIGPFETKKYAENFLKYLKSKFFRVLVSALKQTQNTSQKVYRYVPIQDFTEKSDIDWNKSIHEIDLQLYKKYGLDEKEVVFIEEKIKEME